MGGAWKNASLHVTSMVFRPSTYITSEEFWHLRFLHAAGSRSAATATAANHAGSPLSLPASPRWHVAAGESATVLPPGVARHQPVTAPPQGLQDCCAPPTQAAKGCRRSRPWMRQVGTAFPMSVAEELPQFLSALNAALVTINSGKLERTCWRSSHCRGLMLHAQGSMNTSVAGPSGASKTSGGASSCSLRPKACMLGGHHAWKRGLQHH